MHQHRYGKPVTIGHLDTGVCSLHPALSGKVRKFIAIDKYGNERLAYPFVHLCDLCGQNDRKFIFFGVFVIAFRVSLY